MKKLISCLLAVLLVCSLMSMSVFAGNLGTVAPGDTYLIVGDQNNKNTINEGVGSADGSASADIKVNFSQPGDNNNTEEGGNGLPNNGIIVNRYAVDIEYGELILDLTSLDFTPQDNASAEDSDNDNYYLVWDVNSYEYVLCKKDEGNNDTYTPVTDDNVADDTTTEAATVEELLTTPFTVTGGVQIINHSDLAVATKVQLNDSNLITWDIQGGTAEVNDAVIAEVGKATAKVGNTQGQPTEGTDYTFEATPIGGWAEVIAQFMNGDSGTSITVVGTVIVTIGASGSIT